MAFRVGLVGAGKISKSHIAGFNAVPDVQIAAVCDVAKERADALAAETGARAYTDYEEMFAQAGLDAVSVCTPPFAHTDVTVAAARAGLHVLCEKPLSPLASDARAMVEACRSAGVRLGVGSGRSRVRKEFQAARRAIASGALGEIYLAKMAFYRVLGRPGYDNPVHATWFADSSKSGGGALYDIGCYDMDALMYLLGAPQPRRISAMAYQGFPYDGRFDHPYDVDEHVTTFVRCDGLSIVLETAWTAHVPAERWSVRVLGNKAALSSLDTLTRAVDRGKVESVPLEPATDLNLWEDFVEACRDGRDPISPGEDSVKVMEILSGALLSSRLKREVSVEEVYEIEAVRALPTRGWPTARSTGAL